MSALTSITIGGKAVSLSDTQTTTQGKRGVTDFPTVLLLWCSVGTVPWCGDAEWVRVLSPRSVINFSAVDIFRARPRSQLVFVLASGNQGGV